MDSYTLAIDLGGTNTKMALVTGDLKIVEELVVPTQADLGAKAATAMWLPAITAWRKKFNIDLVGIGSPGPLDCENGIILETPNLKNWAQFSFTEFITQSLGVPCYIENDANCASLGEWVFHKVDDLVMITLGTGVGSGVISQGRLIRGCKGLGVEAGHMSIDRSSGVRCGCGKLGCLEAFVGARRMVERYNLESNDKVEDLNAFAIFDRALKGEALAQKFVDEWTLALAIGVGNMVNLFNPRRVVLTGGVSKAFYGVQAQFQKILVTEAFEPSLKCTEVLVSQLQEKAGLYGAAVWAQQQRNERKNLS